MVLDTDSSNCAKICDYLTLNGTSGKNIKDGSFHIGGLAVGKMFNPVMFDNMSKNSELSIIHCCLCQKCPVNITLHNMS